MVSLLLNSIHYSESEIQREGTTHVCIKMCDSLGATNVTGYFITSVT